MIASAPDPVRLPTRPTGRPGTAATVALIGYLAVSAWSLRGVLGDPLHRLPGGGTGDPAQMTWFLEWTAHCLAHLQSPFVSYAMNAPTGINLMWNTSMLLLGALLAPLTWLAGPIASFNLAMVLGPIATGLTARWWLSRHVRSELARGLGGAAVAFSPFVTAHLGGHLNFVFLPLVPVLLRLLEDVLWRRTGERRPAALLGVAAAAQTMLCEEVVILVAVGVLTALLLAAATRRPEVTAALRQAGPRLALAGVTAAILVSVPLGYQLAGPDRVTGVNPSAHYAQPRDLVVPSTRFAIGSAAQSQHLEDRGTSRFEDAAYLGAPAVLLLLALAIRLWGRWQVRVAIGTALVALLLCFGNGGHGRGWAGVTHPAALLLSLPGLSSVAPQRFALVTALCMAWLIATGLDLLGRNRLLLAGLLLVALTWAPAAPERQQDARVSAFFTSGQAADVRGLTLLLPAPHRSEDRALLYQAVAGLPFPMAGSYALSQDRFGLPSANGTPDPLTGLRSQTQGRALRCRVLQQLADLEVRNVVIVPRDDPGLPARAESVLGQPLRTGGVLWWRLTGSRCPLSPA
ncbi:MAG: hypothetical protein JWN31_14 [Frankiales bacterium]|nr:hypothetical protein [Frankiales bacterium]